MFPINPSMLAAMAQRMQQQAQPPAQLNPMQQRMRDFISATQQRQPHQGLGQPAIPTYKQPGFGDGGLAGLLQFLQQRRQQPMQQPMQPSVPESGVSPDMYGMRGLY